MNFEAGNTEQEAKIPDGDHLDMSGRLDLRDVLEKSVKGIRLVSIDPDSVE